MGPEVNADKKVSPGLAGGSWRWYWDTEWLGRYCTGWSSYSHSQGWSEAATYKYFPCNNTAIYSESGPAPRTSPSRFMVVLTAQQVTWHARSSSLTSVLGPYVSPCSPHPLAVIPWVKAEEREQAQHHQYPQTLPPTQKATHLLFYFFKHANIYFSFKDNQHKKRIITIFSQNTLNKRQNKVVSTSNFIREILSLNYSGQGISSLSESKSQDFYCICKNLLQHNPFRGLRNIYKQFGIFPLNSKLLLISSLSVRNLSWKGVREDLVQETHL